MVKKMWNAPQICKLDMENTEYGGDTFTKIDGDYVEVGGVKFWPSAS